jgi:hypothetical protein
VSSVIASESEAIQRHACDSGLLRRFAPRNDGEHDSAFPRRVSPGFCSMLTPSEIKEGAGNAGCWLHPWPPRERLAQKRALTDRFSRDNPAFPAQWFTAYFALSSVNQLVATVADAMR